MIPAAPSPGFKILFSRYNRWWLLRRSFHSFGVKGGADPACRRPVLYIMNHCSWWDGLLVYEAVSRLSVRSHLMMMDERELRKFRFFRRVGAFSIDKSKASAIRESLDYAAARLHEGFGVWLFPQGDLFHLEERPLRFQSGVGLVLRRCPDAVVVPVTVYLTFGLHMKPEASLWFGEPVERCWGVMDRRETARLLEQAVTAQLDEHRREAQAGLRSGMAGVRLLLEPGGSVDRRYERWRSWKERLAKWFPFSG